MRKFSQGLMLVCLLSTAGCGAAVTSYVRSEAPWNLIKRVAVVPFQLPSENPVERQLVTQLFTEELRRASALEVVDVPLSSPVGSGIEDVRQIAKEYKVDAMVSGSIDETHGTVVHVQVLDVATEELLWSGTYLLGVRAEFFSFRTQQQQFQRGFRRLIQRMIQETYRRSS